MTDLRPGSGTWTPRDRIRTVANLARRLRQVLDSVDEALAEGSVRDELDDLDRRVRAAARLLLVAGSGGGMLDGTLADQLGPLDDESPDASTLAARIAGFADRIPTLVDQAGDTSVTLVGEPEPFDGAALLAYVVEAGEWSLHRLGRLRAEAGDGPPPGLVGRLDGIHVSEGGIPKLPVSAAGIDGSGVAGDRQATRMHHGCPWQAVSLWSADIIDELAAEGHLIGPGAAGENLTLRGLVWRTLRPGVRLGVGPVVLELTAWAEPCQQVADLFVDARSWWIDHDLYPGRARVYARVVRSGPVGVGDEVVIEPELDLVDQPS